MLQWNESVTVRLREVHYTPEDLEAAWYSETDILRFKAERNQVKKLVRRFASVEVFEKTMGDHYSCHGLEKFISSRSKGVQRRETMIHCWNAVLNAQFEHRRQNNGNSTTTTTTTADADADEVIAKEYSRLSEGNQKEAIARALLYTARIHQDDEEEQNKENNNNKNNNKNVHTTSDNKVESSSSKSTPKHRTDFSVFLANFSSAIAKQRV